MTFNLQKSWTQGGTNGRRQVVVQGQLTLPAPAGGAPNQIPASLFRLSLIEGVSLLVASDNSAIVVAAPAADQKSILGRNPTSNAVLAIPAGTYNLTITGQ